MFLTAKGADMKQCLSLSSLRQGADSGPDHSGLDTSGDHNNSPTLAPKNDNVRLYHSLTKRPRRRSPWLESPVPDSPNGLDTAMTRQCFDSKDEFWAAIQRDYNYLMGRQLIDSCCQELLANSSQQGHLTDKNGTELSSSEGEGLFQTQPPASSPISDVETELRGMKQWLSETEIRLGPGITECRDLSRLVVSGQQREIKMSEHKGLHREIEARGRVLSTLLRLCERLNSSSPTALSAQKKDLSPHRRARALKLAQRLHKRWQILYLKNLEWILHLETNTSAEVASDSSDSLSDGDESLTPARKKRMLSAPLLVYPNDNMSPEVNSAIYSEDKSDCGSSNSASMDALEPMDFEAQLCAAFNRSGRSKVANSAVFYFKHSTTEQSSNSSDNEDDEWTFTASNNGPGGVRARLNFDSPLQQRRSSYQEQGRAKEATSGEASEDTSEPPSSPSPSPQVLSDCSASPSSEDLNTSVATCIGQSPEKVVMRPKRSPQRSKRRPVSLPFSLMSPESCVVTPTSKTCSETNLAALSRKKRTMRRSKRRLQRASQSSESEDLMFRLSVLNQVSGIIKSNSFSGTCQIAPQRPDGSYSDPSYQTIRRRTPKIKVFVPPTRVRDVTEESGEPSWDSYQERYNSEAYSEDIIDSEAARKLLEFGDDYSRYLREEVSDSSTNRRPISESSSSRRRRDSKLPALVPDSDSEVEELRYILKLSQESLLFTSQRLQEATEKFDALINDMRTLGPENILNIGELAEMAATCRESKKCVVLVITRIEHDTSGIADLQLIYDLLDRWEDLEAKTQELQRASSLARQVASLRQALSSMSAHQAERTLTSKPRSPRSRMECRLSLQMKLEAIKDQISTLLGLKSQLSDTNLLIHRLSTEDNGTFRQQIKSMLKVQIAELFELWEQTNYELECELNKTEDHLVAWEELDRQLSMLRGSLLRDREVLLSGGKNKEVSDCGSLSDSGISDAGSDVLEVREKELTSLRALANQLPPQSRQDIVQELDAAEKELEQLRLYSSQRNLAMSFDQSIQSTISIPKEYPSSSSPGSRGPRHWIKYVPLCLITLLAIVCTLLQPPNCCEYVNSGLGKYWEQLRFHNGPPPV